MGAIQGAVNQMLGSAAVAVAGAKHFKEQGKQTKLLQEQTELGREQAAKTDFQQLESARAFQASNQALLNQYNKELGGLMRSKPMLEKTGRWTDVQTNREANLRKKIEMYSNAGTEVGEFLDQETLKLGKGTLTTTFEEDKK